MHFKENYFDILIEKFENAKSKKAVWRVATDLGIEDCSLTKFYNYYRDKYNYVEGLIYWNRISSIINALKISDQRLIELYNDAKAHMKEFDDERAAASYLNFKGR